VLDLERERKKNAHVNRRRSATGAAAATEAVELQKLVAAFAKCRQPAQHAAPHASHAGPEKSQAISPVLIDMHVEERVCTCRVLSSFDMHVEEKRVQYPGMGTS
jgi:hypothetical protein